MRRCLCGGMCDGGLRLRRRIAGGRRRAIERRTTELAEARVDVALPTAAPARGSSAARGRWCCGRELRHRWRVDRSGHCCISWCSRGRHHVRAARATELHLLGVIGAATRAARSDRSRGSDRRVRRRCSAKGRAARVTERVVRWVLPVAMTAVHGPVCPTRRPALERDFASPRRSHGPMGATKKPSASGPVRTCAVKIAACSRRGFAPCDERCALQHDASPRAC